MVVGEQVKKMVSFMWLNFKSCSDLRYTDLIVAAEVWIQMVMKLAIVLAQ